MHVYCPIYKKTCRIVTIPIIVRYFLVIRFVYLLEKLDIFSNYCENSKFIASFKQKIWSFKGTL